MRTRLRRIIGFGLIGLSVLMVAAGGWLAYSYYTTEHTLAVEKKAALAAAPKVSVPKQTVIVKPETVTGTPVKIEIASVGISQPVDKGEYDASTGTWTLGYHAVYWGDMTAPINSQTGNTFIYGHDVPQIFGNLLNAHVGDQAVVTTDNGYAFTYTLQKTVAASPTDISAIEPTTAPTLTVQTCSGSWYQYRQMFTFSFDSYKKISA